MNRIKVWIIDKLLKMLRCHIDKIVNEKLSAREDNNNSLKTLVGYRVEVRHCFEEESIFIDVCAVSESATYIRSKTDGVRCLSKGAVLIDMNKSVYTLKDISMYEIKKREVLE